MADNKKWFKVWTSILADPDLWTLSLEDIGRWAMLGALTALHGANGVITTSEKALSTFLRCTGTEVENTLLALHNVSVEYVKNSNGTFTVTILNWQKYQEDSTVAERQKRFRDRERNGLRREEKRGEERRGELKENTREIQFKKFWEIYPGRNGKKVGKVEAKEFFLSTKIKDEELELILQAVTNYARSDAATRGFAKDAVRFLRKDFWHDWIEPENLQEVRGAGNQGNNQTARTQAGGIRGDASKYANTAIRFGENTEGDTNGELQEGKPSP